jgi:hypothetical protein
MDNLAFHYFDYDKNYATYHLLTNKTKFVIQPIEDLENDEILVSKVLRDDGPVSVYQRLAKIKIQDQEPLEFLHYIRDNYEDFRINFPFA